MTNNETFNVNTYFFYMALRCSRQQHSLYITMFSLQKKEYFLTCIFYTNGTAQIHQQSTFLSFTTKCLFDTDSKIVPPTKLALPKQNKIEQHFIFLNLHFCHTYNVHWPACTARLAFTCTLNASYKSSECCKELQVMAKRNLSSRT